MVANARNIKKFNRWSNNFWCVSLQNRQMSLSFTKNKLCTIVCDLFSACSLSPRYVLLKLNKSSQQFNFQIYTSNQATACQPIPNTLECEFMHRRVGMNAGINQWRAKMENVSRAMSFNVTFISEGSGNCELMLCAVSQKPLEFWRKKSTTTKATRPLVEEISHHSSIKIGHRSEWKTTIHPLLHTINESNSPKWRNSFPNLAKTIICR